MRISIQYEDKDIVVVYTPAGLATQTAKVGQPDVVSELKNYLKGGYVGVVHRLDQPVEGLLVFGKTKEATAALAAQLSKGVLNKHYYAVVCGKPDAAKGQLVDYMIKTADNRAEIVENSALHTIPKRAVLTYQILESVTTELAFMGTAEAKAEPAALGEQIISLADIHIETGRFHQIRAQMSHAGLPLLGDQKYGTEASTQISRELNVRNVALCACELSLEHPKSHQKLNFQMKPQGIIFTKFSIL